MYKHSIYKAVDETVSCISIEESTGCMIQVLKNLIVFVALGVEVVFGGSYDVEIFTKFVTMVEATLMNISNEKGSLSGGLINN